MWVGAFLKDCVPYGKGGVSIVGIISLRLDFQKASAQYLQPGSVISTRLVTVAMLECI